MARPQKDGMDYFPHDVYASSDEKIEPLLFLYGAAGYAFYFIHLEYIYRTKDFEFDISDAETIQILSSKLRISCEEYAKILQTALKHDCFDKMHYECTGRLTSAGIKKRAKPVIDKRESMRKDYEKKQALISDAETTPETHIEKESKVKKRKEDISAIATTFATFWSAYPRKVNKKKALDAWKSHKCYNGVFEQIMTALSQQKETEDWTKDGGKFIPHPTSWLNGRRWEDELTICGTESTDKCNRCAFNGNANCASRTAKEKSECGSFRESAA